MTFLLIVAFTLIAFDVFGKGQGTGLVIGLFLLVGAICSAGGGG